MDEIHDDAAPVSLRRAALAPTAATAATAAAPATPPAGPYTPPAAQDTTAPSAGSSAAGSAASNGSPQHVERQTPPAASATGAGQQEWRGSQPTSWDSLLRRRRPSGPAGLLYALSGGRLRLESARERRRRELLAAARTPVRGHVRIAGLSIKGGVGKTTTIVGLGSILAELRGDRVVAVDANPHQGTLASRAGRISAATVRDVLADPDALTRYPDIRALTSQAPSRLEVLASETDPAAASAFGDADYRVVADVLARHYNIALTDCGTGLVDSVMTGVLDLVDQVVVPLLPSLDAVDLADGTLNYLDAHGHGDLVDSAVVVINAVPRRQPQIDLDQLEEALAHRVRAVVRIPWDAHLHAGAVFDLDALARRTREAYLTLAATVAGAFAGAGA